MKKIIIGTLLAVFFFSPMTIPAEEITTDKVCQLMAVSARRTMESRQMGVPLSAVLEMTEKEEFPEVISDLLKALALIAYDTPKYSTERNQKEAITEFENNVLLQCLKSK